MPTNARDVVRSISSAGLALEAIVTRDTIALLLLLGRKVIERTPVDQGVLINNWAWQIGSPSSAVLNTADPDGSEAASRMLAALSAYKLGSPAYLTNNRPEAAVWEFGTFVPPDPGPSKDPSRKGDVLVVGGYSVQAPQGMLGVSLQELKIETGS